MRERIYVYTKNIHYRISHESLTTFPQIKPYYCFQFTLQNSTVIFSLHSHNLLETNVFIHESESLDSVNLFLPDRKYLYINPNVLLTDGGQCGGVRVCKRGGGADALADGDGAATGLP